MFTLNDKRFNIYASAEIEGITYPNFLDPATREKVGIVEIPDPEQPEDYSDETYYRTEQEDAPYVVYTKKSDEQILAQENAKKVAQAKAYLLDTDYKMLPDYAPRPDGEPLADIIAKRAEARELVRELEVKEMPIIDEDVLP